MIKSCIQALEKLHEYGVVHGDIRLSNFVIEKESAKIIDFGFSKVLENENEDFKIKAQTEMKSLSSKLLKL